MATLCRGQSRRLLPASRADSAFHLSPWSWPGPPESRRYSNSVFLESPSLKADKPTLRQEGNSPTSCHLNLPSGFRLSPEHTMILQRGVHLEGVRRGHQETNCLTANKLYSSIFFFNLQKNHTVSALSQLGLDLNPRPAPCYLCEPGGWKVLQSPVPGCAHTHTHGAIKSNAPKTTSHSSSSPSSSGNYPVPSRVGLACSAARAAGGPRGPATAFNTPPRRDAREELHSQQTPMHRASRLLGCHSPAQLLRPPRDRRGCGGAGCTTAPTAHCSLRSLGIA